VLLLALSTDNDPQSVGGQSEPELVSSIPHRGRVARVRNVELLDSWHDGQREDDEDANVGLTCLMISITIAG
jgi:hypothetical protein